MHDTNNPKFREALAAYRQAIVNAALAQHDVEQLQGQMDCLVRESNACRDDIAHLQGRLNSELTVWGSAEHIDAILAGTCADLTKHLKALAAALHSLEALHNRRLSMQETRDSQADWAGQNHQLVAELEKKLIQLNRSRPEDSDNLVGIRDTAEADPPAADPGTAADYVNSAAARPAPVVPPPPPVPVAAVIAQGAAQAEAIGNQVLAQLATAPAKSPTLPDYKPPLTDRARIRELLLQHGTPLAVATVSEVLDIEMNTARAALNVMANGGHIQRIGRGFFAAKSYTGPKFDDNADRTNTKQA